MGSFWPIKILIPLTFWVPFFSFLFCFVCWLYLTGLLKLPFLFPNRRYVFLDDLLNLLNVQFCFQTYLVFFFFVLDYLLKNVAQVRQILSCIKNCSINIFLFIMRTEWYCCWIKSQQVYAWMHIISSFFVWIDKRKYFKLPKNWAHCANKKNESFI